MKIFYDYTPDEVISKVNLLLKKHGLWFVDDGEKHDGYIEYELLPAEEVSCKCWSPVHDHRCPNA